MDFLLTSARNPRETLGGFECEGFEHLTGALSEGRGAIVVSAHFGSWERLAECCGAQGVPLHHVMRDTKNKAMYRQVRDLLSAGGSVLYARGSAVRGLLGALKLGHAVLILPDQNAKDAFVPFFGKPAGTALGVAVIHLRTGAPIVPAFCTWESPGRYRVRVLPPLRFKKGDAEPEQIMERVNAVIEDQIRARPEQWLWLHDRWRAARKAGLL